VVLVREPENGHGRPTRFVGDPPGQLDRGKRLQDRIEWTAEEAKLLTGDHCDAPRVAECFDPGLHALEVGLLGRGPAGVLLGEGVCE
jgi:hypothetical protein